MVLGWAQHGPCGVGCMEHGFGMGTARSEPHLSVHQRRGTPQAGHCIAPELRAPKGKGLWKGLQQDLEPPSQGIWG